QSSPFGRRCPRRGRRAADLARNRHPRYCPAKFRSPESSTRCSNPGPLFLARTTPDGTGRVRRIGSRQGKMGRSLLLVGLRGPYSLEARAQAFLLGLLGTLLLNLARMAAVALVATPAAFVPAAVSHDYACAALTGSC